MKGSDSGDFYMLYIEPEDDRADIFAALINISRQYGMTKPVVIMLPAPGKARAFARPEDFGDLKHVKRQYRLLILFVIAGNEHLRLLAARNGFPAYASVEALSNALFKGQISFAHQRAMAKSISPPVSAPFFSPKTSPLSPDQAAQPVRQASARRTVPLSSITREPQLNEKGNGVTPLAGAMAPATDRASGVAPARGVTPFPAYQSGVGSLPDSEVAPSQDIMSPVRTSSRKRGGRGLLVTFLILTLILLGAGGGLGYYFLYAHAASPTPAVATDIVGHLYYLSSEQVSDTSNQGLDDEIQIDLSGLQPPAPGDSLYAWLFSDLSQGDTTIISLGRLTVSQGSAHLFYGGDAQHTNLLAITSRFLVTEESTSPVPIAPSPDYTTWRYYGIIPQTPNPQDAQHFSLLDHLRHLLASDPILNELELPGGLCNWFYRNTDKLIEWTVSARDNWQQGQNVDFERRQMLRTLAYLDGLAFVQQDLPAGVVLPSVPNLAGVGLIDVRGSNQQPPSYLTHILLHLNGLIDSPGSTSEQRATAAGIIAAMSNVEQWFIQLRNDAKRYVAMSDAQLAQPAAFSLLNDMVDQANAGYTGQPDPTTGVMRQGVIWVHAQIQSLATMVVYTYVNANETPEIVPTAQLSALTR